MHTDESASHTHAATPSDPTLRANPFPKVTDPFCRLPLPTLFYQLEAVHLGDLLRLWVRAVAKTFCSLGFSRAVEDAPDTPEIGVLCLPHNLIASQTDSEVHADGQEEKKTLPGIPADVSEFMHVAVTWSCDRSWKINQVPFRWTARNCAFQTELTHLLGSTDPCPTAVHTEPFPTSVFKVLI